MTPHDALIIATRYLAELDHAGIEAKRMKTSRTFASLSRDECLAHARYLCNTVLFHASSRTETWADGRKVGSHLTALQLCLSFANFKEYTLDDLMNHNRSGGE